MRLPTRVDWLAVSIAISIVAVTSCGGGGACGGCATFETIPGGFPPAKRAANAGQIRVTPTALATITANPAAIIGPLVGSATNGVVKFNVPASCGGSTQICCDGNGNPVNPCGPLDIDLNQHAGDPAVLALAPQSGASQLNLTINTRIKTEMDLPVVVPGVGPCTIAIDSTQGSPPYFTIATQIQFLQDATAGTTRVNATNTSVNFDINDISINGGFACGVANFFKSAAKSTLQSALQTQVQNAINGQTCKKCASGNVADCGPFATACTSGTCEEGSACLQELGLDGRARGNRLFGSFSPGTTGAIDIYDVAGGYATTDSGGIALGLLGGMQPGGAPRDMCGPGASEPSLPTIPRSTYFGDNTNTNPDTGATFDVGFGLHKSQLDQFAFAGYQGGLLCLTVGHSTVAQLNTDTIGLISRSLGKLVEGSAPMAVGLRPQSPPTIALGKNTFMPDGNGGMTLVDPLLDIHFSAMEIDFFAAVDDQYVRVFTVVADVHLPVGLQTAAMGEIVPVIGNPMDAFTNISVKNSEAVTESPDQLASLFPSILGLALPQLSNGLSPIKLPKLGGLSLNVTEISAVDNNQFLAIYANLAVGLQARTVHTTASVVELAEPSDAVLKDPMRWRANNPPSVTLALGADAGDVEYSHRIDDGAWSAWSTGTRPKLSPRAFWLPGVHHVEVRARQIGHPESIDVQPVVLDLPIGMGVPVASDTRRGKPEPFHGQAGASGCGCDGGGANGWPIALVVVLLLLPMRRMLRRIGVVAWAAAIAMLPGCSCGKPCGDAKCIAGDVASAPGRWTSIAGDDKRVMVATYDQENGDLVAIDATDPSHLQHTAVDGVPAGVTPTHDPSGYRGGIATAGPDVGAWTSIVLANHTARIAYEDRDNKTLKYAFEDAKHQWHDYTLDAGMGSETGVYNSMIIDAGGLPAIAYLSLGNDDGMGHRVTKLQLARATKADPQAPTDWSLGVTIDSEPGTCAGLCTGQTCIAPASATDLFACVTPTSDCATSCSSTQACYMGACRTAVATPTVEDIATGTGLFASLVVLPDGRLAVAYYDRGKRTLVLAVESAANSNMFTPTVLDGGALGADRGMWSKAVVASDGTIHIAYQDAIGDQQLYTTWNGMPGAIEVVDDGTRTGDRTHNVGAGAAIYLDASNNPSIAYQDGLVADVYVATRGAPSWSTNDLSPGPLLDGFSIAATTAHGGAAYLAWDTRDPSQDPTMTITVKKP